MSEAVIEQPVVTIPVEPPPPAPPVAYTQEDLAAALAKARKEEKDKLYAELEKRDEKIKEFDTFKTSFETDAKQREEAAAAAARKKAEEEAAEKWAESDAKTLIAETDAKWQARLDEIESKRAFEQATFEKERQFNELKGYAQSIVQAAQNENLIAPELADYVTGNTREEIDASLEFAKVKSQQILEGIRQAQQAARASMPGVSTAGFSSTGPLDNNPGQETYTLEQLQAMPFAEYKAKRHLLLPAASQAGANRGMYG